MKRLLSAPVLIALVAAVGAVSLAGFVVYSQLDKPGASRAAGGGLTVPDVDLGGPFELVNHNGETVTQADFRGDYKLIYFGYSFCPDVCPTDLTVMGSAMYDIGDKALEVAKRVQPLFITVDPARDTPEAMKEYVANFHPRMVGLTGPEEKIAAAAKEYRVYYKLNEPDEDGNYLVDHSAFIYFMGPDGDYLTMFKHGEDPAKIADTVIDLVAG